MLNPQVHKLSRQPGPAQGIGPGVTAYVVDVPEILDGNHPLINAIAELGTTADQSAADVSVLVVVQKAAGRAGIAR